MTRLRDNTGGHARDVGDLERDSSHCQVRSRYAVCTPYAVRSEYSVLLAVRFTDGSIQQLSSVEVGGC